MSRVPQCPLHPRNDENYLLAIAICSVWMRKIDSYSKGRAMARPRAQLRGPKFEKRGRRRSTPKKDSKKSKGHLPILSYSPSNFGLHMRNIAVVVFTVVNQRCYWRWSKRVNGSYRLQDEHDVRVCERRCDITKRARVRCPSFQVWGRMRTIAHTIKSLDTGVRTISIVV